MRLGINGAGGRTGGSVVGAAVDREDVSVAFGVDPGRDADVQVPLYEPDSVGDALSEYEPDAVIDFSVPEGTLNLVEAATRADVPVVTGTTGFEDDSLAVLEEVSTTIPFLKASNFSRGIQALLRALGPALEALPGYDVELTETHHNGKRDAPSGTAHTILERISRHREFETVYGREGIQPRSEDEIGVLVRRAGNVRGEHEIILADNDELLTLSHRAEDRGVFANGAIDAAAWVIDRDPGWYTMADVVED